MMRIGGSQGAIDPIIFWEHSLGCAILSRKLARSVGFADPEKAYLSGLLHDLGYVVNCVLVPEQTKTTHIHAMSQGIFIGECEYHELGFTHVRAVKFWLVNGNLAMTSWK